jgi:glycolate dehydrogenase FAD-binding subunit
MSTVFKPTNIEQAAEAVTWAAVEETPLEVVGHGSMRGFGRPVKSEHGIDLSALSGITLYEPEELVLSARAGTPIAEIRAALAEKNQHLAFEPADLGPLYGGAAGAGSIGGVLACNLAGPRRIKAGAARDHFLGVHAVSGRGEAYKSGGRVVKNVTGYDMCKLLTGSHGTLSVLAEVTVKVMPAPEKTRTVLIHGLDDARAGSAMQRALNSAHEVSGAAHLPPDAAAAVRVPRVANVGGAVTALRVEGPGISVDYRCAALRRELADVGETSELHSHNSRLLWEEVRDGRPLLGTPDTVLWRLSIPPAAGPGVAARIAAEGNVFYYFDWAGGLIWLALSLSGDAGAALVRGALGDDGGHATLLRAPAELRSAVPVFQPQDTASAALTARIKDSFDPNRVLNPGRMYAGL